MTQQELLSLFSTGASVGATDKFLLHTANGQAVEVTGELVRAYLTRGLVDITIAADGYVWINGEKTSFKIEGGGTSLSEEEQQALNDLVASKFPLTITLTGNGGTKERGTSVTPSATIVVKRGTTNVTADATVTVNAGTLTGASFTDSAVTTNKTYTFNASYNGQTARATLSYSFSNYRYKGEIATLPSTDAEVLAAIQGVSKEFSETATLGDTTISANKYYIFAVVGTHTFEIRDKATNGVVSSEKSGTVTVPRINGTANDTYSYVIVPKSAMAQTIKIV